MAFQVVNIAQLDGHDDRAWQIAWNPVKPILASCSSDKTVRLYAYNTATSEDTQNSTVKFTHISTVPTGHTKTVRSIAWAPSGETFATGSFDSNVGIWEQEPDDDDEQGVEGDIQTNKKVNTTGEWECASLLEGHETECKSVAYSHSGTLLASCSRDKTVWIWEVHPDSDFDCLSVLMEHSQDVKCVSWHPQDEILASASYDDTIKLYMDDPDDDWYTFATLSGHTSTVWDLAWSPDGNYLASASDDRTIRVWKRVGEVGGEAIWETVGMLRGHERSIFGVSWGKGKVAGGDGTNEGGEEHNLGWIASVGGEGTINVWSVTEAQKTTDEEGKEKPSVPTFVLIASMAQAHGVYDVNDVAWCPREGYEDVLATTGDEGSIKVWKVTKV